MITHQNTVSACLSSPSKLKLVEDDVYLSYLPMAHILERNIFNALMKFGSRIGVYGGDV